MRIDEDRSDTMKTSKKLQRGMTLLEVLMTMFLVTVGMLAVMSAMVASAKANRYSQRIDVANSMIRMEMERVQNLPFESIASESGEYGEYRDNPLFRHQINVIDNGDSKQVTVFIFFENDVRSASATTLISDM